MWRGIGAVLGGWREGDFWIVAWFGWVARELVGHWLEAFSGLWPVFGLFPGASGPLSKVGHWLDAFPGFRPVSGLFLGASGPLGGVDHWLGTFPGFRIKSL